MKTKIFFTATLLIASIVAQAQDDQRMEVSNVSMSVAFSIASTPKLEIGSDNHTFSNNTNSINFSANERLIIRLKSDKQEEGAESTKKGDVNGDGKVDVTDVTTLVNMVLSNKPAK